MSTFATYSDAQAASDLSMETEVVILGYHAAGDGGLSTYTRVPYTGNAVFTATFSGTTMNVSAVASGTLAVDVQQLSGTGLVGTTTRIVRQISGMPAGGAGTYEIDTVQNVPAGTTVTATCVGPSQGGLQTADLAWWELVSDGEVNIIQFGAKADAVFHTDVTPPALPYWTGTECRNSIFNAQSYLVRKFGGGILNIPAGTYYHYACNTVPDNTWIILKSHISYRGSGRNSSIIIFDDTPHSGLKAFSLFSYNGSVSNILTGVSFENFTMRGILDIIPTSGRVPISIVWANDIKFLGMGMEFLRTSGMTLVSCDNVHIDDFYGYASYGGFVASGGCPNMQISNFYMYGAGDDAISNGTNDQTDPPVRQGISISNGILEESQGPSFNGAKIMTISNLTMRRPVNKGLLVGRSADDTGNTSAHNITIKNIIVTDLLRFAQYRGRSYALHIESGLRTTADVSNIKTYVGAPGRPDASGMMIDLYGHDYGNFETNRTQGVDNAGAGSSGIFVSNFVVQRTLPSVQQASDWGFNSCGLFSPKWNTYRGQTGLFYNDVVDDAMFDNCGLDVAPSVLHTVVSDAVIRSTGAYGIRLAIAPKPVGTSMFTADFDGTSMHVTEVSFGPLLVGQILSDGGNTVGQILSQDCGPTGGTGYYTIDASRDAHQRIVSGSVTLPSAVDPFGFDDLEFANLLVADVDTACVTFSGPAGTPDNVTFRDCVFDGDPLLRSPARGVESKAAWQLKAAFTAKITGTTMMVTAVASGTLIAGQIVFGLGILDNVRIVSQNSGTTPGGVGTYVVSAPQSVSSRSLVAIPAVISSFTAGYASGVLNVTAMTIDSGAIIPGQVIYAPGTALGIIHIISQNPGGTPGGVGTYNIDASGTLSLSFVGWTAAEEVDFTAGISGTTMTVTSVSSGSLTLGQTLFGPGILGSVHIVDQNPGGTPGGVGTYVVSTMQAVTNKQLVAVSTLASSFTATYASNVLTVTAISSGTITAGQVIYVPGTTLGNIHVISQNPGGTPGGVGTYNIDTGETLSTPFVGWTAAGEADITAIISGTNMSVTSVSSGSLAAGQTLFGPDISGSVQIISQNAGGTPGGVGTYIISNAQTVSNKALAAVPAVPASFTATFTSNVLTVTEIAIGSGAITRGQIIYVPGTNLSNIHVISQIDGTPGGAGTYNIDTSGTQASPIAFIGWIGDGPVGADVSRGSGFRFIGCQFGNVVQPIMEGNGRPNFKQDNLIVGQPAAFGFSPSNKGVAYCPNVGDEFGILWEESDPIHYQTLGVTLETGLSASAAMPASGYYAPGQFVSAQSPVISSGKVLTGWRRLTWPNSNGSNHGDGIDWAPQYIAIS